MSRVAKKPIALPKNVELKINGQELSFKGPKGSFNYIINPNVTVDFQEQVLRFNAKTDDDIAITGTMRSIVNNIVVGVSEGFTKKLELVGVGYRAKAQGKVLELSLGFSHPVKYEVPEGITIETPSQTEILVKGSDKQLVGQVSAEIRKYRPPEPYKGKGVKYADEQILRKEAKKKK